MVLLGMWTCTMDSDILQHLRVAAWVWRLMVQEMLSEDLQAIWGHAVHTCHSADSLSEVIHHPPARYTCLCAGQNLRTEMYVTNRNISS